MTRVSLGSSSRKDDPIFPATPHLAVAQLAYDQPVAVGAVPAVQGDA